MPIQRQVNRTAAIGVPGQKGSMNFMQYHPNMLFAQSNVTMGTFVFYGADPNTQLIQGTAPIGSETVNFNALPTAGNSTTGQLGITATGADVVGFFTPGSFTESAGTATSVTGDVEFTLANFEDGVIQVNGITVITVAGGTATLTTATAIPTTLGTVTISAPAYTATAITFTVAFAIPVPAIATPIGIAEETYQYVNWDVRSPGTLTVTPPRAIPVIIRGDVMVVTKTAATVGQTVYASTVDGTISTGAAGSAPAGTVDTGWYVTLGGAASDTIMVSNWG